MTQYFYCKFFLLSSINLTKEVNFLKSFTWKILFISLRNRKETWKMKLFCWNLIQNKIILTPTQHNLELIRLQRKISIVTSFTISKWLKKYFFKGFLHISLGWNKFKKKRNSCKKNIPWNTYRTFHILKTFFSWKGLQFGTPYSTTC